MLDAWEANSQTGNIDSIIDWRSDISSTFKQNSYTEDDAIALAQYESTTSEIQQQDKSLEMQLKRIETEHKAISTEMEAVQKVVQSNIEKSYKTFSG